MPYSITCSTKILTLATAPILFISAGILCEFDMVPGVYMVLSPHEEEVHSSSCRHRCTHSSKRFKTLSAITLCYYGKVIVELEKTQTRNSTVFMVLII